MPLQEFTTHSMPRIASNKKLHFFFFYYPTRFIKSCCKIPLVKRFSYIDNAPLSNFCILTSSFHNLATIILWYGITKMIDDSYLNHRHYLVLQVIESFTLSSIFMNSFSYLFQKNHGFFLSSLTGKFVDLLCNLNPVQSKLAEIYLENMRWIMPPSLICQQHHKEMHYLLNVIGLMDI